MRSVKRREKSKAYEVLIRSNFHCGSGVGMSSVLSAKKRIKAILIPGNGGATMQDGWLPYARHGLEGVGLEVVAKNFPDPILARERYWIPFLRDELKADEYSILIGHSSGALAAMRYTEQQQVHGSVLVCACHTDLGEANEKASGYFDHLWEWGRMREHQHWIIQFASADDPYIPIDEARYVHAQLHTEYYEYDDRGHFMFPYFPELISMVNEKLKKQSE